MKLTERKKMILIHIAWILALAVILSALQPAAFGEHFYRITPYLMIGSVIISQFLLIRECIAGQEKENRLLVLPIGIPMAILQVLYCAYPEESFYWYNGSGLPADPVPDLP